MEHKRRSRERHLETLLKKQNLTKEKVPKNKQRTDTKHYYDLM